MSPEGVCLGGVHSWEWAHVQICIHLCGDQRSAGGIGTQVPSALIPELGSLTWLGSRQFG